MGILLLFGLLSGASFLLSILGFSGRGLILDDHYVFASGEARAHMDKKAYSRQSGVIFLCLGIMFLLFLLRILAGISWLAYASYGVCGVAMVYTVVSHYALRKRCS